MAKYVGRNAAQKEFVKKFDTLTGSRSRWQVWQDMVWLFATAISNMVDKRFFEQREKIYMDIIGKYRPEEQRVFPELYAMLVLSMGVNENGFCDFLGDLFMQLELNFSGTGQFFTPYPVCKVLSLGAMEAGSLERIKADIDHYGYTVISDPSCGAGATLIAAADVLHAAEINYQQTVVFMAQDIDSTVALMCYIQLSLLGCAGYVVIGDTIADPITGHALFGEPQRERCWYTPMFFSKRWEALRVLEHWRRAFSIIATPPPAAPEPDPAPSMEREPTAESVAPAAQEPMVFTVTNDKKQIEGQLTMF